MMPLQASRKQHFKYGQIPFASNSNNFIYGSPRTTTIEPAVKPELKQDVENLRFMYGTNENTRSIMEHSYKRANVVAVETKTSDDIDRKAKQTIDGRKEYEKFLERKKQLSEEMKEAKRKDLELLKTYKPPWWDHGHKNEYRKQQGKPVKEDDFPLCLHFGKPGNGAPLRSDSGNVKAVLKSDPETRFQKRDRQQTLDVLEPNLGYRRRNPRTSSINVLGQQKRVRPGNVAPVPTSPCDIFGQPVTRSEQRPFAAKIPTKQQIESTVSTRRQNGKIGNTTKAEVIEKMVEGEVEREWGSLLPQQKPPVTVVEKTRRHGNKEMTLGDFFDPWGRAGGGAPNRDDQGKLLTQIKKGELVASLKKSEEEKELERKEIEAKMFKINADDNADVTYIENGNYYRMHLDAQRNKVVFPPATQSTKTNVNMGNVEIVDAQPKQKALTRRFTAIVRNKVLPGVKAQHVQEKDNLKSKKKIVQSLENTDPFFSGEADDITTIEKSRGKDSRSKHEGEKIQVIQSLVSDERYIPSAQENFEKQKSMVLTARKGKRVSSPLGNATTKKNGPHDTTTTHPIQSLVTENQQIENPEAQRTDGLVTAEANHRSTDREESAQHDIFSSTSSDDNIERFSSSRADLTDEGAPTIRPTIPTKTNEGKKGPVLSESLKRKLEMRRTSQV